MTRTAPAHSAPKRRRSSDSASRHVAGGHPRRNATTDGPRAGPPHADCGQITITNLIRIRRPDTASATCLPPNGQTSVDPAPARVRSRRRAATCHARSRPVGARRRLPAWAGACGSRAEPPRVAHPAPANQT